MKRIVPAVLACVVALALLSTAAQAQYFGDVITKSSPLFDWRFYGAKCDGVHDDAPNIQAAVTAATAAGAGRVWNTIPGSCAIYSTININANSIDLGGMGSRFNHPSLGATTLVWHGAPGGTMISIATSPGSFLSNVSVHGIALDSAATAAVGLSIVADQGGRFEDISTSYFTAAAIIQDSTTAGDLPKHNTFSHLFLSSGNGGDGLRLLSAQDTSVEDVVCENGGWCVTLGGGASSTNSSEIARYTHLQRIQSVGLTPPGGGGVQMNCGSFGTTMLNVQVSKYVARGTGTCTGALVQSTGNIAYGVSQCTFGTPAPTYTVETGANLFVSDDCGNASGAQVTVQNATANPNTVLGTDAGHTINGVSGALLAIQNPGNGALPNGNFIVCDGSGVCAANGPIRMASQGCTASAGVPCQTTWSCSIGAGGSSCTAAITVPATAMCAPLLFVSPVAGGGAFLLTPYRVSQVGSTLTIGVQSTATIAGGYAVSGSAVCV